MSGIGLLVDSHCHLDRFPPGERAELVARAQAAGVGGALTIGTRLSEAAAIVALADALAEASPADGFRIWCTVGTHPEYAADEPLLPAEGIAALAAHPRVVGIGETGLDFVVGDVPRDAQEASFRAHIAASRQADVPVVIHARGADAEIARILEDETRSGGPFAFVLHCFASGDALAESGIALGGYVSFSGILTFPKSTALRALAARLPRDRLLVETDAPFLAPVPWRGRRNEPSYVAHTAGVLAEAIGLAPDALARQTTENFHRLFRKAR